MPEKYVEEFTNLVEIIAKLRSPTGCPWDKKQTHLSLREFLLQESYEVLEALDQEDSKKLCQELGDLMLQIILHTQIAGEKQEFHLAEVLENINTKLIRRHPHIFGDVKVKNADDVVHNWEEIKKKERNAGASILDSVPAYMPSLAYSQEIQRRAAQAGFDWENTEGVIDKLVEEVKELQQSVTQSEKEDEFGDVFFTLVNVARRMGIDSESALRNANQKFFKRFTRMEEFCRERHLQFNQLTMAEKNALWDEAKHSI